MPRYSLQFANRYLNFRRAEFAALLKSTGVLPLECSTTPEQFLEEFDPELPLWLLDLPSESSVKRLLGRSILLRCACEFWTSADSYSELFKTLKERQNLFKDHVRPDTSYKIQVESYGKMISQEYKVKRIEETLSHIPFQGRIDLTNAENIFLIFEYYGPGRNSCPVDAKPLAIYFGRMIGRGQGHVPERYSIKTRLCIGNTTMDTTLSFLMANIAAIGPGSLVCDPFVGTGSLLISAAHFGAFCVGTEINYNIMHGLGKSSRASAGRRKPGENVIGNFRQYGLEDYLAGACLADASKHDLWRRKSIFDAIITDPPYGIREKSIKVGLKPGKLAQAVSETHPNEHYPMKVKYSAGDVFLDLLNFAADYLVMHGRLVYWLPVYYETYSDDIVPRHPQLRIVANCEQRLTHRYGRRLIVMEKVKEAENCADGEFDGKAYYIRHGYEEVSLRDLVLKSDATSNGQ